MILEYLTKSLIYFIVLGATMMTLKHVHPELKSKRAIPRVRIVRNWIFVSLVPFLRAFVVFMGIILILIPDDKIKEIANNEEEK